MSRLTIGAVLVLAIAGCSGGDDPKPDVKQDGASAGKKDGKWALTESGEKIKADEEETKRATTSGKWYLLVSGQGSEQLFALLDIGTQNDKPFVKVVQGPDELKVVPDRIDPESVDFTLEVQGMRFNFDGRLVDGSIRGNMLFMGVECSPARLVTSPPPKTSGRDPRIPLPHLNDFVAAVKSKDADKLREFANSHPDSPLALDAYEQILTLARQNKLEPAVLEAAAADYEKASGVWGPRMEVRARVRAPLILAEDGSQPDLALKLFDKAEKGLGENPPSSYPEFLKAGREIAKRLIQLREARTLLAGDDDAAAKKAEQDLKDLLKSDELNVVAMHLLAEHAEKQGRTDEALAGYAKLAALPNLEPTLQEAWVRNGEEHPSPEESATKLWKEKHGGTDGLAHYLDEVYKSWLAEYGAGKSAARAEDGGNHVVLVELFTGATCPPCVAADLAVGGVQSAFGPSDVIVLRFHQHIPSDDQLANDDSEARFYYYQGKGTPMICVDGRPAQGIGGSIGDLRPAFERLHSAVDAALAAKSEVSLSVDAQASDGALHVKAEAAGLPKDVGSLRLRMVLAEAEIPFEAANGVRLHEMIVRSMPGTPEGVAAKEGRLAYDGSVKLADFRQKLVDYLTGYEEQKNIEFGVKPLALDKLYFVAFVQNDQTKEVLQSAIVPVSGVIEYAKKSAKAPSGSE